MEYLSITLVFPIVAVAALLSFYYYYLKAMHPQLGVPGGAFSAPKQRLRHPGRRFPMERKDAAPLILLTLVYACTAFYKLGDTRAPETFYHFDEPGSTVTMVLSQKQEIGGFLYYTGLWTGNYTLQYSLDGKTFQQAAVLKQDYANLFKWMEADLEDLSDKTPVKAIRITSDSGPMELGEVAVYNTAGDPLAEDCFSSLSPGANTLLDEAGTIPEAPYYLNSTYFDEIYHARTAYENIRNVYPYEITHPPLGKLILGIGIRIFGMNPFGWRFMGTLFGVLMLPLLYIFLKNMFGKTPVAFCGTTLFAFDFMHLTQTRIATIDTYGVIFILLAYFFMYRFITEPGTATFRRIAPSLLLSGLFFGIGAASKWTVIYAGAGLAAIYFIFLILWRKEALRRREKQDVRRQLIQTILFSVLCFILIPAIIYFFSYLPYAWAKGEPLTVQLVWDNQVYMFHYHEGVTASHPYASKWWMWILDIRPILYYLNENVHGLKSAFGAFSNPVICWGGLLALAALVWRFMKTRSSKALFILIRYLSQLVFWIPIARPTFAYHYFPGILFLCIAIAYVLNDIWTRKPKGYKKAVYGLTGSAVLLFAAFYPVLTGLPVPAWYSTNFLKWFPTWPF